MAVGIRVSQRAAAGYRLFGVAVIAAVVGAFGALLLWDGMQEARLGPLLFGLFVLVAEYMVLRLAIGSALHPAALFVRRLQARQVLAGELLPTKEALLAASRAAGWERPPRLYVMDAPQVNAFVTGRKWERVAGVTTAFGERLTPEEQRAVLAALMVREADDAGVTQAVSSALGPSVSPVPREGVRADFARAVDHYRQGDAVGVRLLGRDAGALARALRAAYMSPGSIKPATPAVADEFFLWPCGQAVTREEEALERWRLRELLDRMDAVGARE